MHDLFEGRRQLIIYHFMWLWDEEQGCPSCSFLVDSMGSLVHLHARRTSLAVVTRGPWAEVARYTKRMAWDVPFYSSYGSGFNYDLHVTLDDSVAPVEYNYNNAAKQSKQLVKPIERHGLSCFLRDGDRIFHTYSTYARGVDVLLNTYNYLDLTALGRQEGWEEGGRGSDRSMSWLRRRDEY